MKTEIAKLKVCPFTEHYRLLCIADNCAAWRWTLWNDPELKFPIEGKCKLIEEME